MSLSVAGKVAIVTGSAHGIGRAIARHLADRGARVMCADFDEAALLADLGEDAHYEGNLRWFAGDLRRKLTISNLMSATVDAFDRIDIVVNASRAFTVSDPLDPEADGVEEMWEQNLLTALRVSQYAARRMIAQQSATDDTAALGTIINLSSVTARATRAELFGYSIACAAVEQMTRSLALSLAPSRIRVNCVAPGSVMSASLQKRLKENPDWRADILAGTPLGRIAAPQELAEVVQFLASDASGFMTGQILTMDGGRSLLDPVQAPGH